MKKAPAVEAHGDNWTIRVRLPGKKSRPRIAIGPRTGPNAMSEARAQESVAAAIEQGLFEKWISAAAAQQNAKDNPPPAVPAVVGKTVREVGEDWTSGRMFERYGSVAGLKKLLDAKSNGWRLARCYAVRVRGEGGPLFGDLPIASVTREDIVDVLSVAPRQKSKTAATLSRFYAILHRLFELAETPCGYRPENSNPVSKKLRPAKQAEKDPAWIFPPELLAVLRLTELTKELRDLKVRDLVRWKVLFVLAVYVGLRKSNLVGGKKAPGLRWGDLDWTHETIVVRRTKNGRQIYTELFFPCVVDILKRWRAHSGNPPDSALVVPLLSREKRDAAKITRALLRAAGIKRSVLFESTDENMAIRFHDARATFVTWAKRYGKTDGWIVERTGHLQRKMLDVYTRLATSHEAAKFVPFPDLTGAIPELYSEGPSAPPAPHASETGTDESGNLNDSGVSNGARTRDNRYHKPREYAVCAAVLPFSSDPKASDSEANDVKEGRGSNRGATLDDALAAALTEAVQAGRWDVVSTLAAELKVRRGDG